MHELDNKHPPSSACMGEVVTDVMRLISQQHQQLANCYKFSITFEDPNERLGEIFGGCDKN